MGELQGDWDAFPIGYALRSCGRFRPAAASTAVDRQAAHCRRALGHGRCRPRRAGLADFRQGTSAASATLPELERDSCRQRPRPTATSRCRAHGVRHARRYIRLSRSRDDSEVGSQQDPVVSVSFEECIGDLDFNVGALSKMLRDTIQAASPTTLCVVSALSTTTRRSSSAVRPQEQYSSSARRNSACSGSSTATSANSAPPRSSAQPVRPQPWQVRQASPPPRPARLSGHVVWECNATGDGSSGSSGLLPASPPPPPPSPATSAVQVSAST